MEEDRHHRRRNMTWRVYPHIYRGDYPPARYKDLGAVTLLVEWCFATIVPASQPSGSRTQFFSNLIEVMALFAWANHPPLVSVTSVSFTNRLASKVAMAHAKRVRKACRYPATVNAPAACPCRSRR